MNYEPNTIDWNVGDLVIHDADEKIERMLMRVIEPVLSDDNIKTEYVNIKGNMPHYINRKDVLHDPMQFGIVAPTSRVNESETWEIYTRALNRWG